MEERMKAEGMKSVSRVTIFSHEPFSTVKTVAAMRCFLDAAPTYPGKHNTPRRYATLFLAPSCKHDVKLS
jgi:hypothetical protein